VVVLTKNEVFGQIKKIIVEKFNLEEEEIKLGSSFVEDLGADSLDLVDLVMALEDEFGIKIEENDTDTLKCIEDVVNFIYEKLGGAADEEDVTEDVDEDSDEKVNVDELDE
jgi:acyl carrier protein